MQSEPWKEAPECVGQSSEMWVPPETEWNPRELKGGLVWSLLQVETDSGVEEFKDFLDKHYVRGDKFRLEYSKVVLRGAIMPPGFKKRWHVAVRAPRGNLVATVTAVPQDMAFEGRGVKKVAIINFLCVHAKLRHKRLAPVLIQEVARRIAQRQVWLAIYTAVAALPRPIASPVYMHVPVDVKHLKQAGFLPQHVRIPKHKQNVQLKKVELKDIPILLQQYTTFIDKHKPTIACHFDTNNFKHELIGQHKFALATQDLHNYAAFLIITSKSDTTHFKAAYLTHMVCNSIPPHTFIQHIQSHLLHTTHLINLLRSTIHTHTTHTTLHSHTPLHFFLYNTHATHTHFLPFAFT